MYQREIKTLDIINQNIKTLRRLENIKSQSQFGKIIGVPSHNINKYENNVIPKPDILRSIAEAFKINLHLFITKELTESNFEQFKIEYNTEAKLDQLASQTAITYEINKKDLDRVVTFFGDKLDKLEEGEINEIDRKRLFGDLRSIFLAFHKKLKEFYVMQDHLEKIIGKTEL